MTHDSDADDLQLLEQITPALVRTLGMTAGDASLSQLKDAPPVLTMCMNPMNVRRSSTASVQEREQERADRLHAFARLAVHAQTLAARPLAKRAFWLRVLRSEMADTSTSGVHECRLSAPAGPRFVVDFSDSIVIDFDALLAFMTTPIRAQHPRRVRVALGLSFANCGLGCEQLHALASFLDALFAHPKRQFDVDLLDLSDNCIHARAMTVVADIVATCTANDVHELKLNNIVADESPDGEALDATPREYLDVLRAVLAVQPVVSRTPSLLPTACHVSAASQQRQPMASAKRVIMKGNNLCSEPFAVLGSALRYDCHVTELLSTCGVQQLSHSSGSESALMCWRWLAFALFYPRPRRFVDAREYTLRRVGPIQCTPRTIATILRTLRDPAVELLGVGECTDSEALGADEIEADERSRIDSLKVCIMKPGARVEYIGCGFQNQQAQRRACTEVTLGSRSVELEALYTFEDGSVCVVVPGAGLGRVRCEDVAQIEREPMQRSLHGQYDLKIEAQEIGSTFERLVRTIGHQIRSLDFTKSRFSAGALASVVAACRHLEHLNLDSCALLRADADALLVALQGELGSRLLSLNLNRLRVGDAFVQQLAVILSSGHTAPVLQELRLHDTGIGVPALTSLHCALHQNQTLHSLELKMSTVPAVEVAAQSRLVDTFQDQVLRTSLAMQRKVAFLSAVRAMREPADDARAGASGSAIARLDQWLMRAIFAFAADQVRRAIFLHSVIRAPGRHA